MEDLEGYGIKEVNKLTRRSNLMGKHFRAVTVPVPNMIWKKLNADPQGQTEWVGLIPDIIRSLATHLNFTYSFAPSRDGKWGAYNYETGKWNGMAKDILDDVADIITATFSITTERDKILDYMIPFDEEVLGFFIPMERSYSLKTYLLPFLYESWAALFVMLIILALVLAVVAKAGKEDCVAEFTLEKCATYVVGAYGGLAIRRWSVTPRNISAR